MVYDVIILMEGDNMKYKNVVIAGAGVLGSQIAFQTAYCGYNVTILIRDKDSSDELQEKLKKLSNTYKETIELMDTKEGKTSGNWARGIANIDSFNKKECISFIIIIMM